MKSIDKDMCTLGITGIPKNMVDNAGVASYFSNLLGSKVVRCMPLPDFPFVCVHIYCPDSTCIRTTLDL